MTPGTSSARSLSSKKVGSSDVVAEGRGFLAPAAWAQAFAPEVRSAAGLWALAGLWLELRTRELGAGNSGRGAVNQTGASAMSPAERGSDAPSL